MKLTTLLLALVGVVGPVMGQQSPFAPKAQLVLVAQLPSPSLGAVIERRAGATPVILIDATSSVADLHTALHVLRAISANDPPRADGVQSVSITRTGSQAISNVNMRKNLQAILGRLRVAPSRKMTNLGSVRTIEVSPSDEVGAVR